MANQDIIKEFLVALGFKVDSAQLKKFTSGIESATKLVGKLAFQAEAMATAVEVAVVKVSSKFESLYYASKRIGDSVEDIRSYDFALGQVGATAGAGLQALENMGEFFRSNPGGERFIQGLGIQTRAANGELRNMTEVMHDLSAVFKTMPYYRAKVVANVLGIDPRTLQAMLRDNGEAEAKFHALARRMGVDQDKAAAASKDFMNNLRELQAVIVLTLDKVVLKIQPFVQSFVKGLEDLDEATDGWSTKLIVLAGILAPLLAILDPIAVAIFAIGIALTQVDWSEWSDELDGLDGSLKDIGAALKQLGIDLGPVGKWFSDAFGPSIHQMVSGFLDQTAAGLSEVADGLRIVSDLLHGRWKKAWEDASKLGYHEMVREYGEAGKPATKPGTAPSAAKSASTVAPPVSANDSAHEPMGIRNNNPGNLRTGPHGSFGRYATPLEGLTAMARNLEAYSRRGLNTVASIINRWAPKSDHNDTEGYIREVSRKLGVSAQEQLNMKDPSTLIKLMSAITSRENGKNPYGAGLYSNAASAALGRPVVFSQKTDIRVDGAGDPHATAKAVAGEQTRVHDAVVRQLKVAAS